MKGAAGPDRLTLDAILGLGPVLPVLTIEDESQAAPLARALVDGGLRALEVTLRTPAALGAVARIAGEVEGAVVGVGTALRPGDVEAGARAGARFAVSPGLSPALLEPGPIPLLSGVATAGEVMRAMEAGATRLKFFPAAACGGVAVLRAFQGPFAAVRFCPTGGIGPGDAPAYLALSNVACVGGSWIAPAAAVRNGDWEGIRRRALDAAALGRRES